MIRSIYRHRSGTVLRDLSNDQMLAAAKDTRACLWVDLSAPTAEESQLVLRQAFDFHPLAVEDVLSDTHIPKLDNYETYLFLVFHSVDMGMEKMEIQTKEMDVFLGRNFLVTVHEQALNSVDWLWGEEAKMQQVMTHGAAYLLYLLLDRQVDRYTPMLDRFERRLDVLGDQIFRHERLFEGENQPSARGNMLDELLTAKGSALRLRRILVPQRDLVMRLTRNDYAAIPDGNGIYFRDVHDHLVRLADLAESTRDLADSTIDTHLALVNNRMNEVMKVLTIMSSIFIPLSFLAGVYGMNFEWMPELDDRWAYPLLWLSFLSIAIGQLYFFRRRGWL